MWEKVYNKDSTKSSLLLDLANLRPELKELLAFLHFISCIIKKASFWHLGPII